MDRALLVFGLLFLALPLLGILGAWMGVAALTMTFIAVGLLILGFTIAIPFVDLG
jgi:hypothetical protein